MMEFSDLAAIILAGGFSQRMGRFKPLLPLGDHRTIERVVRMFQDAGIDEILVVVGHRGDDIRRVVDPLNVVCVENPDYAEGMFTSVLAGVRALPEQCRAFFMHPVDIPMVRWQTVRRLAETGKNSSAVVLYPTFDGRRGHPTLIRSCLGPQILQWSGMGGLRSFLQGHETDSLELPVADEAVLMDLDTPGDYRRMMDRLSGEGLPTEAECRKLMEGLPAAVAAHCRAVAAVARCLAASVRAAGLDIDVELVRTAALLHDIARTGKDHARVGACLLETHGFTRLAPIVAAHMDLEADRGRSLDEIQIVHLADKLVIGDQLADLEQRFARKMEKYGQDPAAAAAIARRRDTARDISAKVARIVGMDVEAIVKTVKTDLGAPR
ncbi:MAG: NTP transferase domain-containing protein [Desulfobacteraceae bacterium]|jgi:molybdenum cofactor cytidylyltransferase